MNRNANGSSETIIGMGVYSERRGEYTQYSIWTPSTFSRLAGQLIVHLTQLAMLFNFILIVTKIKAPSHRLQHPPFSIQILLLLCSHVFLPHAHQKFMCRTVFRNCCPHIHFCQLVPLLMSSNRIRGSLSQRIVVHIIFPLRINTSNS